MRSIGVILGTILLTLGVLFLFGNFGLLPVPVWQIIGPGILIAIGLWIVMSSRRSDPGPATRPGAIPLGGATAARLTVHHGAGRLDLTDGAQSGMLMSGEFAGGLEVRSNREGDTLVADARVPSDAPWQIMPFNALHWKGYLAAGVPLDLALETGASESRIDLTRLHVRSLRLSTGASATTVWLPASAGSTRVEVHAGAASVRLIVPDGVGARITARSGLAEIKVAGRFTRRTDGSWESEDYATSSNRTEIDVEVGVGEVRID